MKWIAVRAMQQRAAKCSRCEEPIGSDRPDTAYTVVGLSMTTEERDTFANIFNVTGPRANVLPGRRVPATIWAPGAPVRRPDGVGRSLPAHVRRAGGGRRGSTPANDVFEGIDRELAEVERTTAGVECSDCHFETRCYPRVATASL